MSEGIPDGWVLCTIGEIAHTSAGGTPSTQVPEYWNNGTVPWMSSGEVHKKHIYHVDQCITELGLQNSSAKLFPPKTILMALAGQGKTRGTVAISEMELTTNQSIAGINVIDSEVDPYFVFHDLNGRYIELRTVSGGSGRAGLNLRIINELPILLPTRKEQNKIASILASVEEVIDKTESQISKLQDLKKGMMQELLTMGIGHAEFKDSPVGSIPKGWELMPVDKIAFVKGGKRLPKGRPFAGYRTAYPYIRISDFKNGYVSTENIQYVLPEDREKIKRYTISQNDVCVSIAGVYLGLFVEVPNSLDGALLTENAAKLVFKNPDKFNKTFIRYLCQSELVQSQLLQEKGVGAGVPKLALFRISETVLPIPAKPEQDSISNALRSVDENISTTSEMLLRIKKAKKALMQELLTGKVRVKTD